MGVSATVLGKDYGLNGQEMNAVLSELEYLSGKPGEYVPTAKGVPFITETDHHRGTGGYARYNRYWTTRTFDPSIKKELKITPELKEKVRADLKAARVARQQAQSTAQAEADVLLRAKIAAEKRAIDSANEAAKRAAQNAVIIKKVDKVVLIVACVAGVCYVLYKLLPVAKRKLKQQRNRKRARK